MRNYLQNSNLCLFILALAICLGTDGCIRKTDGLNAPRPDLFWPNPPDIPRIKYINAVSRPGDLNIDPGLLTKAYRYIIGGKTETSIVSPHGITTDTDGRLYVVDAFLHCVHVLDAKGNAYNTFPDEGTPFASPVGIAIDDTNGFIYVTDSKQNTVNIFRDGGKQFVKAFGEDTFKRPTGIAVNPITSELLVVDTLQSRVFRYDLSDLTQKGSFGGSGKADSQFHYPTHISVTLAGNIIISDSLNFRVQIFSPEGRFVNRFGQMGHEPGTFSRPKGVAADSDGNIYVVDALFDNIQVFDGNGRLLMAFGEHGKGCGAFWLPTGIYIDKNDMIYVSDSSNNRIQMFQYLKKENVK